MAPRKCYSKTFAPLYNAFEWRLDAPVGREIRHMSVFSSAVSKRQQWAQSRRYAVAFHVSCLQPVFKVYMFTGVLPIHGHIRNSKTLFDDELSTEIPPATAGDRVVLP